MGETRWNASLKFLPLARFFLSRPLDRVQLVVIFLLVVGVVHVCFFSTVLRDPLNERVRILSTWILFFAPALMLDAEMHRRQAVRVFVWPRHRIARVLYAYLTARMLRALVIMLGVSLLVLNTWLGVLDSAHSARIVAGVLIFTVYMCAVVTFWSVALGIRYSFLATVLSLGAATWLLSRFGRGVPAEIVQVVVMPIWVFTPPDLISDLGQEPWRLAQIVCATSVWIAATWCVLRRSYR
jgi:hypothetical protein